MNKQEMILHYTKQSECYNQLKESLPKMIEVLKKFDGKVINIRLEKALQELFSKHEFIVTIKNKYDNKKEIELYNQNRGYKSLSGEHWNYLDYNRATFKIDYERLNAVNAIESLNKEVTSLKNQSEKLLNDINNINIIEDEYNRICNLIKDFNNKYDFQIRKNYKFDRVY